MDHKALIEEFYTAFSKRDGAAMTDFYHPEAHFTDPAFDLHGSDVGKMWRMLCKRGKDLKIEFRDVEASGNEGRAHWDAAYTFSATGRKVFNQIDAEFVFEDGKIKRHIDTFDFWKWTRMALGLPGMLLGWSPMLRNKVRSTAAAGLKAFKD